MHRGNVRRVTLIFRINGAALEIAGRQSLVAIALFFWMGTLGDDLFSPTPEAPEAERDHEDELQGMWRQWHTVFDGVLAAVGAEDEARASLERQYFGGQPVLFSEAAKEWADVRQLVEHLAELAALLPMLASGRADRRASRRLRSSIAAYAAERVAVLADDARVTAFELLGERPRAAAIVERRLRTQPID